MTPDKNIRGSWNYRIVEVGPDRYGLFEVYYDSRKRPWTRTERPIIDAAYATPEEARNDLLAMLHDASLLPPLRDAEFTETAKKRRRREPV